jgi:hypothetical protein
VVESQGLTISSGSLHGATLWTFEPAPGVEIGVAIGHGLLAIGAESGVAALLATAAEADAPRGHTDAEIAAMDADLDGCMLSVIGLVEMLEMMESMVSSLDQIEAQMREEGASEEEIEELDAMRLVLPRMLEIARDHLSGSMGTSLDITGRGFAMRVISR